MTVCRQAERDRAEAIARRNDLVREAMQAGLPREAIARQVGVAPARLYQIRDGQ